MDHASITPICAAPCEYRSSLWLASPNENVSFLPAFVPGDFKMAASAKAAPLRRLSFPAFSTAPASGTTSIRMAASHMFESGSVSVVFSRAPRNETVESASTVKLVAASSFGSFIFKTTCGFGAAQPVGDRFMKARLPLRQSSNTARRRASAFNFAAADA